MAKIGVETPINGGYMALAKMTDILVSTSAFIATFTYQGSDKAILEINPIGKFAHTGGLPELFFHIITSDSSQKHARLKREWQNRFVAEASKRITEEFWDSAQWASVERLCLTLPYITCVLYDKEGNVAETRDALAYELLWALERLESALFSHSESHAKQQPKKAFKRDHNRQTHKYFLHHRTR
jgi:hypothetical protein